MTTTTTRTRRAPRAALAALLVPAAAAGALALGASPAEAATGGANAKNSSSVLYTRACLDYSRSACALHVIKPGGTIPYSSTLYLMPGAGWRACSIVGGGHSQCVYGSTYKQVGKGYVWRVS